MKATRTDIGMAMLAGMRITVSEHAVKHERLFPESRHRSARIRKKLMKRFGGETRMKPAAFSLPGGILMHPELYAEVRGRLGRQQDALGAEAMLGRAPAAWPVAPDTCSATDLSNSLALTREALTRAVTSSDLQKSEIKSGSPISDLTRYNLDGPAKMLRPLFPEIRDLGIDYWRFGL